MADKKKGYILLWRSIRDHWIWNNDEPFTYRCAWIDLILMANHEDTKIQIRGEVIPVHAGQKWTSIRNLAKLWHWSENRVRRFLKLLKKDGMIEVDRHTYGTLLTLVNYRSFADGRHTNGRGDEVSRGRGGETPDGRADGRADGSQTKNVKELKELETLNALEENRPPCPGDGYYWSENLERWIAAPKGGDEWQ